MAQMVCVAVLTTCCVACVSIPEGTIPAKNDPWEGFNRNVYSFNDTLDDYVIRPITKVYEAVLPVAARNAISNVFGNVGDVFTAVNQLLQGKPGLAASDVARVMANTTFGIAGIFDVASNFGLEKHMEDFGQTFGVWGFSDGPYMVLPFLGPSNVRDTVGWAFDIKTDVLGSAITDVPVRNSVLGLRAIDQRSKFLNASSLIETAAFDRYSFVRDAYTQRRRSRILDGKLPPDEDDNYTQDPEAKTEKKLP